MIDADGQTVNNDASRIGDIKIVQSCGEPAAGEGQGAVPGVPGVPGSGYAVDGGQQQQGLPFDLALAKSAGSLTCTAGGDCAFDITITNVGGTIFAGPLYVNDQLPPDATLSSATPPGTCIPAGAGVVECAQPLVTLAPGASTSFHIVLKLPLTAVATPQIDNCASIAWMMNAPPNNLVVEQALALAGYPVGPIDDIIDPATQAAIVQYQNDHGLTPTGTINEELRVSLFGGDAGTGDANPADDQACATVGLAGTAPATVLPPAPIPVDTGIDLAIKKEGDGTCQPGGTCKFTVTVSNAGWQDYKGTISFTDTLPSGWTLVSHDGGLAVWVCEPKGSSTFTCKHNPSVPIGPGNWFGPGDSVSVTLTASVPATATGGGLQNCATIIDNPQVPQDQNAKNNDKSCVEIALPGAQQKGADLAITKDIAGTIQSCPPDATCTFEIEVTNNGPDPITTSITVTDTMPTGWSFVGQSGAGWDTCKVSGQVVTCATIAVLQTTPPIVILAPKASLKLELEFKTPPAGATAKTVENCAAVASPGNGDATAANDKACVQLEQQAALPDLRIFKKGPAKCWEYQGTCSYDISVVNYGNVPYDGPLSIIESNTTGISYKSNMPTSPGWACKDAGTGKIRCEYGNVKLGYLQSPLPLALTVGWQQLPSQVTAIKDCVEIAWAPGKGDADPSNDKTCVTTPIDQSPPHLIGVSGIDWLDNFGVGTISCVGNCSFYQFTGRLKHGPDYSGPLRMNITLPTGSAFPKAVVSGGGAGCSAAKWTCRKTGVGFHCANPACTLRLGDEVSVRMEGHIVPNPTKPRLVEETRTACSVLEWKLPTADKGIEQSPTDSASKQACVTTHLLPLCPSGMQAEGAKCVWPPCPDGMKRQGAKCVWPPCPRGMTRQGSQCVWPPCPRGMTRQGAKCVWPPCPDGMKRQGAKCVWPPCVGCPRGMTRQGATCVWPPCPDGMTRQGAKCVWPPCPRGMTRQGTQCVWPPCRRGTTRVGANCVALPTTRLPDQFKNLPTQPQPIRPIPDQLKKLPMIPMRPLQIPGAIICPTGQVFYNGRCMDEIK